MMKLVTIHQADHDVLRHPAKAVSFPLDDATRQFLDDMETFIYSLESPYGSPAGLAATQVGKSLRIVFINMPPEARERRKDAYDVIPLMPLVNPFFTPIESEGKSKDWEACYSVPDEMAEVWRYKAIYFEAITRDGEKIAREARGFLARLIQHEVGHLNGEIYTDLITDDCRFGPLEEMMLIRKRELI